MSHFACRRGMFVATVLAFPLLAVGCPKKPNPVVEDAAPPPPPATSEVTLNLAPLEEDAGDAGGADADAGKRPTGPAVNPNQAKIRACCAAMRGEARRLGNSLESAQLNALAATCDNFAKQVGPGGNAPEFAMVRGLLAGRTIPGGCQF